MSPADGFAITMLGIIALTLGMIAWMLFFMLRGSHAKNHDEKEVEELLDEVAQMLDEEEAPKSQARQTKARDSQRKVGSAWEKDPDWWKQG